VITHQLARPLNRGGLTKKEGVPAHAGKKKEEKFYVK